MKGKSTAVIASFLVAIAGIAPAHAATTTITVWSYGNVFQKSLVKAYMKAHPTITIKIGRAHV